MEPATLYLGQRRLPTLLEVLNRRTLPPVDLFSFYIYMRDQQRSVDYLDFWLDVSQHMSLCRHYVRELRRTTPIDTSDLDNRASANIDEIDPVQGVADPLTEGRQLPDGFVSRALREDLAVGRAPPNAVPTDHSSSSQTPRHAGDWSTSPGYLTASAPQGIHRSDIRASAEKILYTYLLPGSEREIIVPEIIATTIAQAIEQMNRDDPEVFDVAKDYVFQAIERDAFPGFLRFKVFGNLVPLSMMLRLLLGLLTLFGGLWAGFIFIFLDYSRMIRCWIILPLTIGVYLLVSHQFLLDPLIAIADFSEYTFLYFHRVREPFVRSILRKRGLLVLFVIFHIDLALCALFIFVPGKRL